MSRLYVRVMTGFYSHRKTAKLRSFFGNDAFWIPPRLWAYAAEHQPDGNLSEYTSEVLADVLGCSKYANGMLEALKKCGFVDESGMIHDWNQHNGYHEKYADRAKKAAAARWSKEKSPTPSKEESGKRKGESGDKHCLTDACSIKSPLDPDASLSLSVEVFNAWNETAKATDGLPACLVMSDSRRRKLAVRVKDSFFAANWKTALEKVSKSAFCLGCSERGWRASLDWFIQPDTTAKLMEGKYDTTPNNQNRSQPRSRFTDRNKGTLNEGQSHHYAAFMEAQAAAEKT